jgi:cell wall-associated NlpC family hydrolase
MSTKWLYWSSQRTTGAAERMAWATPRLLTAFAAVVLATSLVLAVGVPPAAASSPQMTSAGGVRDCTNTAYTGCSSWGSLSAGTQLAMVCWIDESWAVGEYNSNRWFYIVTSANVKGFVHSSRVWPQTNVPNCSTHRGVTVTRWASRHVGIAATTAAERSAIPTSTSYWSGYCATFATASYKLGAGVVPRYAGDAKPRYNAYKSAGLMQAGTPANVGSLVFWPNLTQWGHVAVYVGNGMVVSTRGVPGETRNVARVSLSTFGTPAGWVAYWNV